MISCICLAQRFAPSGLPKSKRLPPFLRINSDPTVWTLARFLLSPVRGLFLPHFPGHRFRLIPASGSFAASAFPVPRPTSWVPPIKQPLALEAEALASGCPRKMGQEKGENSVIAYLNSITLVGFVGSDPDQRQSKGNGSK